MKDKIVFRNRYHKLAKPVFTTVRGKSWFKKLRVGELVEIVEPSRESLAVVEAVKLVRISDMTVEFVKADAEYPGCVLNSLEDFVTLLNSLRAPMWNQATLNDEMTVILLRRTK
jgi:hypothetical protein